MFEIKKDSEKPDHVRVTGDIAVGGNPPAQFIEALMKVAATDLDPNHWVILEVEFEGRKTAALAYYKDQPNGRKTVWPMFVGITSNMVLTTPSGERLEGGLRDELERSPFYHKGNFMA